MKKKLFLSGILGVALVFAIAVIGCDNDDGDEGKNTDPKVYFLSGSFGDVQFDLESSETSPSASVIGRSISRAVGDSYDLNGVLKDGDLAIRLRGSYDRNSGNWSVSARSNVDDIDAIYTIDGSGGIEDAPFRVAGATVVSPSEDPDEWGTSFAPVTQSDTRWNLTGATDSKSGGMPSEMHGYWSAGWDTDIPGMGDEKIHMTMRCLISDWKIKATGRLVSLWEDRIINQNQNIVEIEEVGGVYDVISCYPEYRESADNLAAALTEWLGLNEGDITVLSAGVDEDPEGPWVKAVMSSPYPEIGGFSDGQWEEIQSFYMANGWETWAEAHEVTPDIKFTKYRFSSDGAVLNMTKMVEGADNPWTADTFGSLEDLKDKDLDEEHKWYVPDLQVQESWKDLGVLTVPFARN